MQLYTYYRSTSSYRVRIALALKGLDYQALPVNLIAASGGEHRQAPYLALNPQGRVPALRTDDDQFGREINAGHLRAEVGRRQRRTTCAAGEVHHRRLA